MKRRNFEGRKTSNSHISYHDAYGNGPKLYKTGLAVFRPIDDYELEGCKEIFSKQSSQLSKSVRGEFGQHGLALNLVSLVEVKNQRFKHNIGTQDVIDEIYSDVSSLRRPMNVQLGSVGLFGAKSSRLRSISIAVHENSRQQLKDERNDIIEVLNQYAEGSLSRCDWGDNDVPHISLGKIAMHGEIEEQHRRLIGFINEVIPEEVKLDRAILYNPTRQ